MLQVTVAAVAVIISIGAASSFWPVSGRPHDLCRSHIRNLADAMLIVTVHMQTFRQHRTDWRSCGQLLRLCSFPDMRTQHHSHATLRSRLQGNPINSTSLHAPMHAVCMLMLLYVPACSTMAILVTGVMSRHEKDKAPPPSRCCSPRQQPPAQRRAESLET
jgi:hypothetical protein